MTKLTREDILKLARLSRLELSDSEIETFQSEISEILNYVEMLKNVDTGNLKPTSQVTGLVNVTRSDEVKEYAASPDDLLKNVSTREKRYIKVKRMIG
jgi:aspartyl-tRNA(Asn)/glutamyl-tRNA(Gln) amidotransferase subunit C